MFVVKVPVIKIIFLLNYGLAFFCIASLLVSHPFIALTIVVAISCSIKSKAKSKGKLIFTADFKSVKEKLILLQ